MNSVEQLLCWSFGCTRAQLYTGDYERNDINVVRLRRALDELREGRPLQYVIGEAEFMGLKFYVNPSVFIPRPETEILVENALAVVARGNLPLSEGPAEASGRRSLGKDCPSAHILDLGVGSGAIAVSLTKFNPYCKIIASDISEAALKVARSNAVLHGVSDRIAFVAADLFAGIKDDEKFDLIVSNPPYIPAEEYDSLPAEVKSEPKAALGGGEGGLNFYSRIIPEGAGMLRPGGYLAMEMGFGQAGAIRELIEGSGAYCETRILTDYNGIDRVVFCRRKV